MDKKLEELEELEDATKAAKVAWLACCRAEWDAWDDSRHDSGAWVTWDAAYAATKAAKDAWLAADAAAAVAWGELWAAIEQCKKDNQL
jgi:hypothetical protein